MQLSFQHGETTIKFNLTYSRRKTIGISVEAPDKVNVIAPAGMSEDEIITRVKTKAKWIVQKLGEVKAIPVKKEFVNGESFMYLGKNYSLQLNIDTELKKPIIKLSQGKLVVDTPTTNEDVIKKAMKAWYRNRAQEQIKKRLEYYQPKVGAQPGRITVKEQKKRWGSCSSQGNLNFNWRIVMAPSFVLDYVIVHELCHLIHLNHSREFWNLLRMILPDYEERKNWLKDNGVRLDF